MEYVSRFETPFGPGFVVAGGVGIRRVLLPFDGLEQSMAGYVSGSSGASTTSERAAEMLTNHFRGCVQQFENIEVELLVGGEFRQKVLHLIRGIPAGQVRSYGEVATLAGAPRASRAVGGAMAANPVPVIVPCHRVISSDRRLTGYTAPGGLDLKKWLLKLEGVEFIGERVCQVK